MCVGWGAARVLLGIGVSRFDRDVTGQSAGAFWRGVLMNSNGVRRACVQGEFSRRRSAFSLVELLTVIFIISLLISILVPSLNSARLQAKNIKVSATLKAVGDGMEMFRTENDKEFRASNGYPTSQRALDLTEGTPPLLNGAHWLARAMLGKDLNGFVARRNVPPGLLERPTQWYNQIPFGMTGPIDRVGPYVNPDSVEVRQTKDVVGFEIGGPFDSEAARSQILLVDTFGYPILYYAANTLAKRPLARLDIEEPPAVYTHEDNEDFTGQEDTSATGWDFGAGSDHKISNFGFTDWETIGDDSETFCWYLLDKKAYEATLDPDGNPSENTAIKPVRNDAFLLITAGKDALYGSSDDVVNFTR